ncbi:MAG: TlpA disulfide reductase family protein [Deltaproteobacteria bacterium]|nr:TlpA disulfide reductase family protein [Deltaproteobacteria bacterium]
MKKYGWMTVLIPVVVAAAFLPLATAFGANPIQEGTQFNYTLPSPVSTQVQNYLGLKAMGPFKVNDVKARCVVIELMSSTCPHCQAAAPNMNELYERMQTDPQMADVKFFAIALADSKLGVETFRKEFKTVFPILLDKNHTITHSLKGLATPTTIIVSTKSAKVLAVHPGGIHNPGGFIKQIKFVEALDAMDQSK